jgi:hypothetical protein
VEAACHREDMKTSLDSTQVLMLHGTVAHCPDCGDERVLVPADGADGLCCTSCDAAVFVLGPAPGSGHRRAEEVLQERRAG